MTLGLSFLTRKLERLNLGFIPVLEFYDLQYVSINDISKSIEKISFGHGYSSSSKRPLKTLKQFVNIYLS